MAKAERSPVMQDDAVAEMERLRKQYTDLDRKRTACQTNLENAQKRLDELMKQARERYGTDDLEQLRKKLDEMRAENRSRCEQYAASLEKIQKDLAGVEAKYRETTPT